MKLRLLIITLSACLSAASGLAGQSMDDEYSIQRLADKVCSISPNRIVGLEIGTGVKATLDNPVIFLRAIQSRDIAAVSKIIMEQTDYECLINENSIIIMPKANQVAGIAPLSMQQIACSPANNIPVGDFLRAIRAANQNQGTISLYAAGVIPVGLTGSVTISAESNICHKLLLSVCNQLRAHRWIMTHSLKIDPATRQPIQQSNYKNGSMNFY